MNGNVVGKGGYPLGQSYYPEPYSEQLGSSPKGGPVKTARTPATQMGVGSSTPGRLPWETGAPGGGQGQSYYPVNPLGPYSGQLGSSPSPSTPMPQPQQQQPGLGQNFNWASFLQNLFHRGSQAPAQSSQGQLPWQGSSQMPFGFTPPNLIQR